MRFVERYCIVGMLDQRGLGKRVIDLMAGAVGWTGKTEAEKG